MNVQEYLRECRELTRLCTQNGWIDNDTLKVEILQAQGRGGEVIAAVQFEEIIMEGAGCIAGRVPCYGQLRMRLDEDGNVIHMAIQE